MLTAIRRGAGSARTMRHLRPAGKPAPPRPRRPESSSVAMTDSTSRSPARQALQQRVAALATVARVVDVARCPDRAVAPAATAATTLSQRARGTGFWPTTAAGACSQRPMQGARDDAHLGPEERRQALQQLAARRPARTTGRRRRAPSAAPARPRLPSRCRSGDRSSRPRRPRPAPAASPAASAARCAAERWPKRSWILCRCSISRSRWRDASPSSCCTSASASGSTRRPLGASRLRCRVGACGAIGMIGSATRLRAAPRRAPTGTSRRAPRPGSRSSRRRPECRARRGTAPPPRPRRRRRARRRSA